MSTASIPATPPPAGSSLDEFSDKLSPMLVKELRQGLRAKTFVILFLALQALLGVVLLSAVGITSGSGDSGPSVSRVIFFFFAFAALVAQPLRGIGALHNEIKGQTIDLMVLTRLGAWRIVLGKWVAIVSQTSLLLVTIAPYLILRYFFGRMNLFAELNLLALIFLGSAVFTAITVGISAIPSILIRGLLPLGGAILIGSGIIEMTSGRDFEYLIKACALKETGSGWGLLAFVGAGVYFGWFALALGASMIAPMAENHSTVRRLFALLAMGFVGLVAHFAGFQIEETCLLLILFGTPAVIIALTEPFQLLPPICRPFLKFGTVGKVAGRFLYPGWPSGVLFTGLLIAVAGLVLYLLPDRRPAYGFHSNHHEMQVLVFSGLGMLILSALIVRLFVKKERNTFGVYLLSVVSLVAVAVAVTLIANETTDDSFLWWLAWIPTVQAPLMDWLPKAHWNELKATGLDPSSQPVNYTPLITTGIVTVSIYYAALLVFALRKFPAIRAVENEVPTPPADQP
ncbi:hypothetical protein [Luteolibacter marinus]|uniref:hypothetical protein n=1 Tax=Luteolibacter marinus TaxID=2776705 RepID=UPI00186691EF|nr:hypothetical protein [Luteolibacter marinus]